ncbi:MAG TPA: bacillithiol biosynthesis deacetylase BshB1 [Longimicrobiales bacterium]|nr:bacillithiol biosynthesis deacetylase BshB1 [Longimicrobiales bacterium]
MMRADILAIMAHPDDAELLCAGLLIRSADSGQSTAILDLTGGERGSAGSAGLRAEESRNATRILGVGTRANAGLPDSELENSPAARLIVARHIRELRPRAVILHWPDGRHPDHRVASELGRDACFVAGLTRAPIDQEPHRPSKVIYCASYREEPIQPSFVVDITDQIDRKIDAIRAYGSQFDGKSAVGDVFGGAERELYDQVRIHAAHYGSLIRRPYGEPYWMRETLRVDDVLSLNVNTF